jgi:hypothetical protein
MIAIKTHKCPDFKKLYALVGGVAGAIFMIERPALWVTNVKTTGNECHVYTGPDGKIWIDEIVEEVECGIQLEN